MTRRHQAVSVCAAVTAQTNATVTVVHHREVVVNISQSPFDLVLCLFTVFLSSLSSFLLYHGIDVPLVTRQDGAGGRYEALAPVKPTRLSPAWHRLPGEEEN